MWFPSLTKMLLLTNISYNWWHVKVISKLSRLLVCYSIRTWLLLMALKLTGTTSTSSYTLLIVLRSLWGVSMVEGHVGYVCHCCTRWTGPTVSRNIWYELFSVIYVVHKLLLIHSFTAVIFLKQKLPSSIVPIQTSELRLVTTWCLCRPTQFPLEVKRYLFMGGLK